MNLSKVGQIVSLPKIHLRSSLVFGAIILIALFAFEIFNYSTTEFALHDLLGDLRFIGIRWATILTVAFCGIDFAGIARLFTANGEDDHRETWYLFGAWLLAATMNALLTWWGVSMAVLTHNIQSTSVMAAETVVKIVPIFVAVMVWLIRILIIGTISLSINHLQGATRSPRATNRAHSSASSSPTGSSTPGQLYPRPGYSTAPRAQRNLNTSPARESNYSNPGSRDGSSNSSSGTQRNFS